MYRDDTGKSYIAIHKATATKAEALHEGNKFFHERKDSLRVQTGDMTLNGELVVGVRGGEFWVISRKEKKA